MYESRLLVVSYLLQAGASVNIKDRWAGTPLDDALRHNHDECAKALRSAGGTIGGREHSKFTTTDLITAASQGELAQASQPAFSVLGKRVPSEYTSRSGD